MKLSQSLAKRLKEVLTEGKWLTGTSCKEQLSDLNWKEATQKIDDLNTIAKLTYHINYYIEGVTKVLEGKPLDIRDKFSFDCPPIKSQQDWDDMVNKFCSDSKKFIDIVSNMPEEKLFENFVDEKYGNNYKNINGIIDHSYYHFGQISLIKKLIS